MQQIEMAKQQNVKKAIEEIKEKKKVTLIEKQKTQKKVVEEIVIEEDSEKIF